MISLHDVELEVVLIADESVSEAPPSAIMIWECILNLCNLVKLSVTYISVSKRFPNHSQFQKNQDDWGGFGPPGPPLATPLHFTLTNALCSGHPCFQLLLTL